MSNLKVFPLKWWMKHVVDYELPENEDQVLKMYGLIKLPPITGKDGWYLERHVSKLPMSLYMKRNIRTLPVSWFEYKGASYLETGTNLTDAFKFDLEHHLEKPLSDKVLEALYLLKREGFADERMKRKIAIEETRRIGRKTERDVKLHILKYRKEQSK